MITFASLCSGGGGADLGAMAAGLEPVWGIEYKPRIAEVARANGLHIAVDDVRTARPLDYEPPDFLLASPPCPSFSQANTGGKETAEDVGIAQGVARFITAHGPRWFTLENVGKYAYSKSWATIQAALDAGGYFYTIHGGEHSRRLCSADFDVPQTRRRFWVRAVRGALLPPLPAPTPWRGWYAAVEDLLPGCPESPLANWQREPLKDHPVVGPLLVGAGGFRGTVVNREAHEPAMTITANRNQCDQVRAVLVGGQYNKPQSCPGRQPQTADTETPAFTVTAQYRGDWRAVTGHHTVQMTLACMSRFQGWPDDYVWSGNGELDARVNGNAVPPPQFARIAAGMVVGR